MRTLIEVGFFFFPDIYVWNRGLDQLMEASKTSALLPPHPPSSVVYIHARKTFLSVGHDCNSSRKAKKIDYRGPTHPRGGGDLARMLDTEGGGLIHFFLHAPAEATSSRGCRRSLSSSSPVTLRRFCVWGRGKVRPRIRTGLDAAKIFSLSL